jgi:MFS family permease
MAWIGQTWGMRRRKVRFNLDVDHQRRSRTSITDRHTGFSEDIGATPNDVNLAVSLFFVTFVLLQPPSAAVGRWLGPKHWITIMMVHLSILPAALMTDEKLSLDGESSHLHMPSYMVGVPSSHSD